MTENDGSVLIELRVLVRVDPERAAAIAEDEGFDPQPAAELVRNEIAATLEEVGYVLDLDVRVDDVP